MTWQQAATVGLVLAALALLARLIGTPRMRGLAAWLWQAGVVIGLYGAWQWMLDHLVRRAAGAQRRGRGVLSVERWFHLPSEHATQHLFLSHPFILQAADRYYAWLDFPGMGVCLLYLWWRRRPFYWSARVTLVISTTVAAFIQAIPVAPPRLVPSAGVVDAGEKFGYAVYSTGGSGVPGQLTSMPSVHVVWATLVAVTIIGAGGSAWRWLVAAHPVLTIFVVVITGNHYWLDAIVGALLVALALGAQWVGRQLFPTWRREPPNWRHNLVAADG